MADRFIKALLVGAILGLATEYIIRPLIEKPVKDTVEKVI